MSCLGKSVSRSIDQLIVTCAQLDHADAPLALTERTE